MNAVNLDGRVAPDSLTIAYLAIGAYEFLQTMREEDRNFGIDTGELEFIDEVTRAALELDTYADATEHDGFCFCYEIAQPFGYEYARAIYEQTGMKPAELIRDVYARAINACK
ncbi:MAG TPA: hypothetical protein VF680_17470 [Allosphingosinicella sp.]|jgi:hypothetical protein